jgi:hypothetical protein
MALAVAPGKKRKAPAARKAVVAMPPNQLPATAAEASGSGEGVADAVCVEEVVGVGVLDAVTLAEAEALALALADMVAEVDAAAEVVAWLDAVAVIVAADCVAEAEGDAEDVAEAEKVGVGGSASTRAPRRPAGASGGADAAPEGAAMAPSLPASAPPARARSASARRRERAVRPPPARAAGTGQDMMGEDTPLQRAAHTPGCERTPLLALFVVLSLRERGEEVARACA